MGTSASSGGPGSGVPLVPPWVPDPEGDETPDGGDAEARDPIHYKQSPAGIAPQARFRAARTQLGAFGRSGDRGSLGRGLGHYTRTGLGGARTATRRMAGTARNAGALYGVLDDLRRGAASRVELGVDAKTLSGLPTKDIADRIAQAISPIDGTLDAEASRESMAMALTDLARRNPQADLAELAADEIELVMEFYVANDICRRIQLDVGRAIFDKAPDAVAAVGRLDEMHRFVQQCVGAAFRRRRADGAALTQASATRLATRVIRDTFDVFEGYLR